MNRADAETAVRTFLKAQLSASELGAAKLFFVGSMGTNDVVLTIKGLVNFNTNAVGDPPEWAFFVDKMPNANWEHPCIYILVLQSGAISATDETAPPASVTAATLTPLAPLL